MSTQCYSVSSQPITMILSWVDAGDIAIPEIQRPFVWKAVKVRDFLDSLYRGYPVGYLIAWRNPDVMLKDGTSAVGKRILIDGQQRVTALMAAIRGKEILTKDYKHKRIVISFNPQDERFEVKNPAIEKDPKWIADVSKVFAPTANLFEIVADYIEHNPTADKKKTGENIQKLSMSLAVNVVGLIELSPDLDIETVTEIFVRVNSAGVPLGQADFAMSKIAVNKEYDGHLLRKAIDYFCHLAIAPEFYTELVQNDTEFAQTDLFRQMAWLKSDYDNIYDPSYTDMLRVAFATQFHRGKLQDLVALLSGRNFEMRTYEEAIVADSFVRLKKGIMAFMNETNFQRFTMIIKSAGFVDKYLIGSQSALDFAYSLYLTLRELGENNGMIEQYVRKWFVFSLLTGRYSSGAETEIDADIKAIREQGIENYATAHFAGALSDAFWKITLPQNLTSSVSSSPYFRIFRAAQVKNNDLGFLSRDITVRDLVQNISDIHHLFPKAYLKDNNFVQSQYNQIANYVVMQTEINIAVGKKEPATYMAEVIKQCENGERRYGNITSSEELHKNLAQHCIPEGFISMTYTDYDEFLKQRRYAMAMKIRDYFRAL